MYECKTECPVYKDTCMCCEECNIKDRCDQKCPAKQEFCDGVNKEKRIK